ncbi:MAG: hypothetical protein HZB42_10675 [Sphingobacteriales bacterium]|nr:hypothetical protein [Sphingobacteriales bacterium]
MKTIRLNFCATIILVFLNAACQKSAFNEISPKDSLAQTLILPAGNGLSSSRPQAETEGQCNSYAFIILLESRTLVNGNWEWIWSVQNSNPGNGNNGTIQDLSHWGMQFGTCVVWPAVIGAAYSADGNNWTGFSPSFQPDPSQGCMTDSVLKFDFGTTGNAKSYYKLVFSQVYQPTSVPGYYKAGNKTGCCTFSFTGVGCGEEGPIK